MRALRDAAARGVRVRLLVDDLYTAGDDALWLGLAAQPGDRGAVVQPVPVRPRQPTQPPGRVGLRPRAHAPPHAQQAAGGRRCVGAGWAGATSPTPTSCRRHRAPSSTSTCWWLVRWCRRWRRPSTCTGTASTATSCAAWSTIRCRLQLRRAALAQDLAKALHHGRMCGGASGRGMPNPALAEAFDQGRLPMRLAMAIAAYDSPAKIENDEVADGHRHAGHQRCAGALAGGAGHPPGEAGAGGGVALPDSRAGGRCRAGRAARARRAGDAADQFAGRHRRTDGAPGLPQVPCGLAARRRRAVRMEPGTRRSRLARAAGRRHGAAPARQGRADRSRTWCSWVR